MTNPWAKTAFAFSMNTSHSLPHGFGKFCKQVDFSSLVPLQLAAPFFSAFPLEMLFSHLSKSPFLCLLSQEWWILILPLGPAPSVPAAASLFAGGNEARGVTLWVSCVPSRVKTQLGGQERMGWIKGQEKGAEPGEEQKAAMRVSVQQSNPPRTSKQPLSSCNCFRGELAPSPFSWPLPLFPGPKPLPRTAAPPQPVSQKCPVPTPACPHPFPSSQPSPPMKHSPGLFSQLRA